MEKITFDHNCLIDLERNTVEGKYLQRIIQVAERGAIEMYVSAIHASENRNGNDQSPPISRLQERLASVGLNDVTLLKPMMYLDICYLEHCVLGDDETIALEKAIHETLFPEMPFEYSRLFNNIPEDQNIRKKWLNAKCDVQAIWCHIRNNGDVFVTNDGNFHKLTKKGRLEKLGAKKILTPELVYEHYKNYKDV